MTILLAILILIVVFYIMAVLTEEFFVPAIDTIAHRLKLSSEAAGATLLAMGSSAPEFFTSFIAILGLAGSGHADLGAGTIVGSAIFNVLVIVGVSAMFRAVQLQWKPVLRDQMFYIITIATLLFVFWDGKIVLAESIVFVVLYVVYVFFVVNWKKWFSYKETPAPEHSFPEVKSKLHSITHRTIGIVVPDPIKQSNMYVLSFIVSILLIAGLSWLLVEQIIVIADAANINATFLALTVLAAGTSVPDLIGSIVVAKQGRGDMAVSNAIGSNIFDILFCLGLPWTIALLLNPGSISVGTNNLTASVLLLFATVVAMLFLMLVRKWHIGHKSGLLLVSLYAAYCIYIAVTIAR